MIESSYLRFDPKQKYASQWGHSVDREQVAQDWLRLLYIVDLVPCGNGTLISSRIPGYHTDISDRFDFYSPSLNLYFEVTGSEWTKKRSWERFNNPILAVLKAKVDDAYSYGLEGRLWFIFVAEIQGEIRFIRCADVPKYPIINYAKGEGAYYGVPWMNWLPPFRFTMELMRK